MGLMRVIFEDSQIVVLDKPAGMVVNRAKSVKTDTVQDWLEVYLNISGRGIGGRAGIVHRLDKETSGLLLVAKTEVAFKWLQRQFKQRRVEKRYQGLVHGRLAPKEGEVTASISRSPFDRKKFGVFLGGRRAKTVYRVVGFYRLPSGERFSLVEFMPETGRTHQIRVHAKHLGYPIVSDPTYAGRKTSRADRSWCPRLFLHASHLSLTHPGTGKKFKLSSKLPKDLEKALESLKAD